MSVSGSYNYPGVYGGAPALGSGNPYAGRGPVEAFIVGGVTLSASLSASDGTTNVELIALSGTEFSNSASFSGADYSIIFGPQDVSIYSNVAITLINNSTNKLESGSVEFSPNNSSWETDWNTTAFASLSASGGVRSMQITGNSRKFLRVRAISSGSGGALTGSIKTFVHVNNG